MEYRGPIFRVALRLPMGEGASSVIESDIPSEKISRLAIRAQTEVPIHFPMERLRVYTA